MITHAYSPVIRPVGLIPLKPCAWLDLNQRRSEGNPTVKADDSNKHRADVFRLATLLPVGETLAVPPIIATDLRAFLNAFPPVSPDWPAILASLATTGIRVAPSELFALIGTYFGLLPPLHLTPSASACLNHKFDLLC